MYVSAACYNSFFRQGEGIYIICLKYLPPMWLILVMKTSESCMYSLELCFQICNSIEHYISLVRKTFRQFYNPFQIQEFYKAMSFLHVFSASLEKKKRNESWAVLVSRSAVCYAAESRSFELVCKILKCTINESDWEMLSSGSIELYEGVLTLIFSAKS